MRRLILLAALSASTLASADPIKLVVPDFNAIGPSKEKAQFFTEHISGRLSEVGAQVTTSRALAQLLGIERQRQLMGCAGENSSCIAELASALGSDALLLGDIAQIGTLFQVNLKVVSGADGAVLSSYQARVGDEAALLDELDKAAFALMLDACSALHRDPPRALRSRGPNLRLLAIVPAALGVAAGAASGILFLQASQRWSSIPMASGDMARPVAEVERLGREGNTFKLAGWVCAGVAVAALATSAILFILGRPAPVKATVTGTTQAGAFILFGDL
ncbi:MAG: hypothetical protein IPJ65_33840 [Archangiaceae bacterium]|nr:hypothetical protein [Archangiaceae bacterium]